MRNSELDEPRDDLDLEITSLDGRKAARITSSDVRVFARRHKRPLTIATVGLVALAILLVGASTPTMRGLVGRALGLPTATPPLAMYPGEDLFYIQANPAWGHLTVDGRAITRLPVIGGDMPLRLARGRHELVWSAEPFETQRCLLSVPINYSIDTCVDRSPVKVGADIDSIVSFTESLNTLSANQHEALVQAVQEELNARQSTVIVPEGELYALPPDRCSASIDTAQCYGVAPQPLYAMLHFRLDTNSASNETCLTPEPGCTYLRENCFLFCTVASNMPDVASTWNILAPVLPLWTFQKQDGSVIERDIPDNMLWDLSTGELADESLIGMQLSWQNAAWQVNIPEVMNTTTPIGLNPVCEAAQNVVGTLQPPVDSFGDPLYLQWQYASGLVPASGCLEVGASRLDAGSVNSTIKTPPGLAYCLLRFGVLLAVNDQAHHYWPHLPRADAFERSLAQQLATAIPGNS